MSTRKFIRLSAVLFIPLLILGVVVTNAEFKASGGKYENILCAPFLGIENCRQVGDSDGNLYQQVKRDYPAWFSVSGGMSYADPTLYNFIEASTRVVRDVQILSASPHLGQGPEAKSLMESLAGRRATVKLGMPDNKRPVSVISDEVALLVCNSLRHLSHEGENMYRSACFGNEWSGPVTYRAIGTSRDDLDKLLSAINEEVDSRKTNYNIYRAVNYPIFIYCYFLISFFVWIIRKAVRFVKNG